MKSAFLQSPPKAKALKPFLMIVTQSWAKCPELGWNRSDPFLIFFVPDLNQILNRRSMKNIGFLLWGKSKLMPFRDHSNRKTLLNWAREDLSFL